MPKPTFDINEYELRGLTPDVFTKEQRDRLNKTLSRVQGQIDWTAQLLGFNGPNYWGQSDPKADFSYNWTGLPETMNEKRQMQVGAFGVYNKDKEYDQWPSPFNRTEIKASGDLNIHVYEKNGFTYLGPAGQGEEIDFRHDPTIFVGSSYVFDAELTLTVQGGGSVENVLDVTTFYKEDKIWTRVFVKNTSENISIVKAGSVSSPAYLIVSQWEDITDWNLDGVKSQFIGLWGNKGNQLSMDFAFDSLDLHGYDEVYALHFDKQGISVALEDLLEKVGLEPTEWTQYAVEYFSFVVGENCEAGSPDFPVEIITIDNGDFDAPIPPSGSLDNGIIDPVVPTDDIISSGIYEKDYVDSILYPGEHEFFSCSDDCNYKLDIYQKPAENTGGIGSFIFKIEDLLPCASFNYPCIEWVFDPDLDNGEYERTVGPKNGPWAIANDGEYDELRACPEGVSQGIDRCGGDRFCGFENGTYDRPSGTDVRCDDDSDPENVCTEADGGIMTISQVPSNIPRYTNGDFDELGTATDTLDNGILNPPAIPTGAIVSGIYERSRSDLFDPRDGFPDYSDCECYTAECCLIDNELYDLSQTPPAYLGPNLVDGGTQGNAGPGDLCLTDPIRVQLTEVVDSIAWKMEPSIRNSLTPLRIWKNHVLTVIDQEPPGGTDYYNFLVADENRGPEPEDSYRYFVRLPLEYQRNGKEWSRAVAICNNQGYFSAPPKLAETEDDPKSSLRPFLYDETYWRSDLKEYSTFYHEDFLSSQLRRSNDVTQPGYTESSLNFDGDSQSGFAPAFISEYDPFSLRLPDPDGEWIGYYMVYGANPDAVKTGFLETDVVSNAFRVSPFEKDPIWDESAIKNPNVEFPDSNDKAALKNYVVSYAYFACDFSAADDPVFEPGLSHNWRREEVECAEKIGDECVSSLYQTNTAYRLHQ